MIRYVRQAWLVLLLGLVFGVALAGVNSKLAPRIRENELRARQEAAIEVTGGAEAVQMQIKLGQTEVTVYRVADRTGQHVGWAVPAQGQGYADTIKLIVGLTPRADEIMGIKVIYNQETPGLGNKITDKPFRRQFAGKAADVRLVAVQKAAGLADEEIHAITGATISSEAVCTIVYQQVAASGLADALAGQAPPALTRRD